MALTKIDDRGVTYPLDLLDNEKIRFGTGNDLELYHTSGSESYIDNSNGHLFIQNGGSNDDSNIYIRARDGENSIVCHDDGAVELYYDNSKKLSTTNSGIKVERTDSTQSYITMATSAGDAGFIFANSNTDIELMDRDGHPFFKGVKDGAASLYYDNVKKFETTSTGTNVTGVHVDDGATHDGDVSLNGASYNSWWDKSDSAFKFDDNAKIKVGTGEDLQIYHNATNSFIQSNTGYLKIQTDSLKLHDRSDDHPMIEAVNNGAVNLYHDNVKKFSTTQYGIEVHGTTDNARIAFGDAYSNSRIGYIGLNRFGIDAHDGIEVRDPSDSYGTRFKIDENGYITKPKQPYAKIHFNHYSSGGMDSSTLTKQESVAYSIISNGMSHSNGRITVPVDGKYLIYGHNNVLETGSGHMSVRVNGSNQYGMMAQNADSDEHWKSMSIMTIMSLSANDYVESWLYGKQDGQNWNSLIVTLLA
tara:strand:+ start:41 stop:1459 length:1419 start_codon:yes stop_codon:yes gene_type:complete